MPDEDRSLRIESFAIIKLCVSYHEKFIYLIKIFLIPDWVTANC